MNIEVVVDEKLTDKEKQALYKKYENYLNAYFNGNAKVTVGADGKVSIAEVKIKNLNGSGSLLVNAINDSKYKGTVDVGNGGQRDDVFFGKAENFGVNKLDLADLGKLDAGKVGVSGAEVVAHETLEAYKTAEYKGLDPSVDFDKAVTASHNLIVGGGMVGFINPLTATPTNCGNCTVTKEATANFGIQRGANVVGGFKATFTFDTPIPKADVEKIKFPKFEVRKVEKQK